MEEGGRWCFYTGDGVQTKPGPRPGKVSCHRRRSAFPSPESEILFTQLGVGKRAGLVSIWPGHYARGCVLCRFGVCSTRPQGLVWGLTMKREAKPDRVGWQKKKGRCAPEDNGTHRKRAGRSPGQPQRRGASDLRGAGGGDSGRGWGTRGPNGRGSLPESSVFLTSTLYSARLWVESRRRRQDVVAAGPVGPCPGKK